MEFSREWRYSISVSAAIVAAAAAFVLYRFDPAQVSFYPQCVFHAVTGWQCPGCGTTRALHHLLHGDVAGAFRLNPMLFALAPFTAVSLRSRRFVMHPAVGWTALAATITWWIVRNLPFWPW
jgi:hypothetical protein